MPATSGPLPGERTLAGVPGRPWSAESAEEAHSGSSAVSAEDGLAKLLAFRYGVPRVEGEQGWARLTDAQQREWRGDADMVRGYLVHGLGWRAP